MNICSGTIITHEKYSGLPHNTSPSGTKFVDKSIRRGILAQLEEELMSERDEAKRRLKEEKDPGRKRMYDSRQNKIKLICNSVYGILSASGGRFVRVFMGLAVTSQGRKMIMAAKRVAESDRFSSEIDKVIYGGYFQHPSSISPEFVADLSILSACRYRLYHGGVQAQRGH